MSLDRSRPLIWVQSTVVRWENWNNEHHLERDSDPPMLGTTGGMPVHVPDNHSRQFV
jgi:hypothetical protein